MKGLGSEKGKPWKDAWEWEQAHHLDGLLLSVGASRPGPVRR